jgi:transposase InsO family protein
MEGDTAFEPRSRRPHTSPTKIPPHVVELIIDLRQRLTNSGLDAGSDTIRWHLQTHHDTTVSSSTIRRYLVATGLITPQPKKRPRSSFVRFEASLPNEMWQTDFTHIRLADATTTEVLSWLDDHSRYALSVTAHTRVTGAIVADTFLETATQLGFPASVLSDNAMVYTTRFAGGRGGRNHVETLLADLGIEQKHAAPNHPTTCGKVERFQQTLKQWIAAQPTATTLDQLQQLLDSFTEIYNHHRPHRALNSATPAIAYQRLPRAQPAGASAGTHYRIRHDRIDTTGSVSLRRSGRMHHIGIGRTHAGTRIIMLINDLDIRIIDATTGELLRHLTLNPNRGYQPRHNK